MGEAMAIQEPTTDLVAKARTGDRQAFGALAERYRSRLLRQIESRMGAGVRTKLAADDVLQETFAVALESIERLSCEGDEGVYRWFAGIAEHVISNAARTKSGRWLEIKRDVSAGGSSPSQHLRRNERFERLQGALKALSAEHREALLLSRVEGLKIAEIAERMNRSPNAVYKLIARALVEVRRIFGDTDSLNLPDRTLEFEEPRDGH